MWWVLVPLGAVAVAVLVVTRTHALADRVLVAALAAVVLSSAANTTWFQRYVDFPVLLVLLALVASGRAPVRRIDVLRWAGIVALSVVWAAVFGRN